MSPPSNPRAFYAETDAGNSEGVMKLLDTLKGIQAGRLEDKHGWRQEVKEPKA